MPIFLNKSEPPKISGRQKSEMNKVSYCESTDIGCQRKKIGGGGHVVSQLVEALCYKPKGRDGVTGISH